MKSFRSRFGLVLSPSPAIQSVKLRTCERFAPSETARRGEVDIFDAHGRNDAEGEQTLIPEVRARSGTASIY